MSHYLEAIQKRISVRTYADRPLGKEVYETLEEICLDNNTGPFGHHVRLQLLDLGTIPRGELRGLGTYGTMRGVRYYILAAVKERKGALEAVGFCLEKVILEATALGLGTCWIGGLFRRNNFARQMDLARGEMLPAITPVGYGANPSLVERVMRGRSRARQRKPWEELFFHEDGKTPLSEEGASPYQDALEAVRLGPSASNKQPWRIVKMTGRFRLFLEESPRYNNILGKYKIQYLDMGIAMCHFQLAAEEAGLKGRWEPAVLDGAKAVPGLSAGSSLTSIPIADWVWEGQ